MTTETPKEPNIDPENQADDLDRQTQESLEDLREQTLATVAKSAGRAVIRSAPRPAKVPGAVLSPQASRELQEELADIRRAERDGVVGGDSYYIGVRNQPQSGA